MIGYLKGKVIDSDSNSVVLLMGDGVGYKVSTPYSSLIIGEEVELFIHTHMKESSLDLFGFKTRDERKMFEMLLGVSGIGPKLGITILEQRTLEQIVQSIKAKNPQELKVNGVGLKTAEKIIIELRNKIDAFGELSSNVNTNINSANNLIEELTDVLEGLGYSQREITIVTQNLDFETSLEDLIKISLSKLKRI